MNKDLIAVFDYLEREKGIKRDVIIKAIEESLEVAARRSIDEDAKVRVEIQPRNGAIEVYCEKEIVEKVEHTALEISLEDAQELDPDCEIGQFIDVAMTPSNFGRIAAQKARQIITQKLRGAERDVIYEEYRHRVNEIISGTVKRFIRGSTLVVDLGKVEALMPGREYPKTEHYQVGERVTALLAEVQDTENGGAEVILSRSSPEFVRQLFLQEVPEISDETVIIEKIVREAGYRTKIAVSSRDPQVDPVGACVGMRGIRVKNIVRELHNEKIDIIPHSDDAIELLQNALDPIEIRKISVNEDERVVSIVVDDDNFAAVIGKRGMNIRLNGKLIGHTLEAERMTDYNKAIELQRLELIESDDASLDEELRLETINPLIVENLLAEGYRTPRDLLKASTEELAKVPGVSIETAEQALEEISKQRK
ncbi:MAG: transcription termination/antitermination protein NusA [Waddliaceae bacterium]|nr:transcription termination/antitermination protein NusA [Waddliaceae bacterium]